KRGTNTLQFAEIDKICRKNSVSESGQFLREPIRFDRIGNLLESLHQKRSSKKRVREYSRQVAGILLSRYLFRLLFTIRHDLGLRTARIDRHGIVVIDKSVHLQTTRLVLVRGFLQFNPRRVSNLRQDLRSEHRIVFKKRVQNEHANSDRFTLL